MPINEIINEINSLLPETETIISSAFVKLYTSDQKTRKWVDTKLSGIIVLIVDRILSAVLLRLYDLSKLEMTFETEAYFGFGKSYKSLSDLFHCFSIPGGIIGLSFAKYEQSKEFLRYVKLYSPVDRVDKVQQKAGQSQNPKWIQSFKSILTLNKNDKSNAKIEISKPYAVQLVSRVEWDKEKDDFNLDSLPQELRKIFTFSMDSSPSSPVRHTLNMQELSEDHHTPFNINRNISSSRNSKEIDLVPRLNKKIKIYKFSPSSPADLQAISSERPKRLNEASGISKKKTANFNEIPEQSDLGLSKSRKLESRESSPENDEKAKFSESFKKREEQKRQEGKSYAQLYRDLLKQGVANRHKNMNLYGNSEFSSESSSASRI